MDDNPHDTAWERRFATALDILADLVAFDTTSQFSNLTLVDYVVALLSARGASCRVLKNEDGTKANLVATVGPRGIGGGLMWSGHSDVVPVDGQRWNTDPFKLHVDSERAYARGACDMKGFIACCLALLSTVEPGSLRRPVSLVLTYDEEVGCLGARDLTETLAELAPGIQGCVIGEPTNMAPVVGNKGKQNYRARFEGAPAHASLAPGRPNAIVDATSFVSLISGLNQRFLENGPFDRRFDYGHPWINVGRINGGQKANIVPGGCEIELEVRSIPEGLRCSQIGDELSQQLASATADGERDSGGALEMLTDTPGFVIEASNDFVGYVHGILQPDTSLTYVPFGTEAGHFWHGAGIPTVVCGPGSIEQAHTADEWVDLAQLRTCLATLYRMTEDATVGSAATPPS